MIINQETIKSVSYYFDRVRINVYFDRNRLLSVPELKELNSKHVINVLDAYKTAQCRYHSRIEVTAPTNDTLDTIEKAISDCYKSLQRCGERNRIERYFAISKVEIARDFIVDKESSANFLADELMSMTGKKYTSNFKIYDSENDPRRNRRKRDPRLKEQIFSKRTGYWGNKNKFEYAVYGRYSKINKLPAAHTEWRIMGFSNIRKKTGIRSISDMKSFDFKKFFEKNDQEFLVYQEINYEAIGRWIQGIDGRRTLTKLQKKSAFLHGLHFCSGQMLKVFYKDNDGDIVSCNQNCRENCQSLGCEIRSAAALKQYLKQNKGKIRNRKKQILSGNTNKFFSRTPITISLLLK
jgi:hypothetical protein